MWASLCLALAFLAPLAAQEPTFTLKVPRQRLSATVDDLADQLGVIIRLAPGVDREIGPLDMEGTPEKVLSLLSRMAGLELRREGAAYLLAPRAAAEPEQPAAPKAHSPAELIAQIKPWVVLVLGSLTTERAVSQGTGFVVGTDGLIATNAHVVRGTSALKVVFPDNTFRIAVVAAIDEDKDLAVLRVGARFTDCLRLGDSNRVREGDDVAITGYPMALELLHNGIPVYASTAKAAVNAIRPAKSSTSGTMMPYIQIDAPVNPGYSGGPLFRQDNGLVVGVVQSKIAYDRAQDTGVGFAIPVNLLRRLITEARANPVSPPTGDAEQVLANSFPMPVRLQETPQDAAAEPSLAITRPFDMLPPGEVLPVPEPPAATDRIALHPPASAEGGRAGKMVADPHRPRLYAADINGNSVVVVDTEKAQVVRRVFTGSKPYGVAMDPEGKRLYVANSGGSEIFLLDLEKLEPVGRIPLSFRPFDLVMGPGGKLYVTTAGTARTNLRTIDLRRQMELPIDGSPLAGGAILTTAPAQHTVFAAERTEAPASLFQCYSGGRLSTANPADEGVLGANIQDIALSADGKRLYIASQSLHYVSVLDAESLRPLGQLEVGTPPVAVAVAPEGREAYVCHGKNRVDRFDTRTFLRNGSLPLPESPLRVALSPDGQKVFVVLPGGIVIREASSFGPPVADR